VEGCAAKGSGRELRCEPTLQAGDASTVLTFVPLPSRSVVRGRDARKPQEISLGVDGRPTAETLDLPAGRWELVWAGYTPRRVLALEAGTVVRIALESTTGRCDLRGATCALVRDTLSRTVGITVQ